MKIYFVLTILCLGINTQIEESFQADDHVLVFMDSIAKKSTNTEKSVKITIGTASPGDFTRVRISTPLLDMDKAINVTNVNVTRKEGAVLTFDSTYKLEGIGLQKKTFIVESDNPVTVIGSNQEFPSTDSFLVLSKSNLGCDYFAVTHAFKENQCTAACQIAVTAITDRTIVNVTLHHNFNATLVIHGKNYFSGDTIVLELEEFETFEIQSTSDLTGTHIRSSKPIAVFSGNKKTAFRNKSKDHLVEQLLPVESLGHSVIAISTPNQEAKKTTYFKVIATEDNTMYSVNGDQSLILHKSGDWREHEEQFEKYFHITSSKPILVVSMLFYTNSYPPTDPCMTVLLAEQQWLSSYIFIASSYYTNYFIVIIKDTSKNGLLLNDKQVEKGKWFEINGTDLVGGYILMDIGNNYLTHSSPNLKFGAYAFGYRKVETYCSPVGAKLDLTKGCVRTRASSSKEETFHHTSSTDDSFTNSKYLPETMVSSYTNTWYSSVIMPSYIDLSSKYEPFSTSAMTSATSVFMSSALETSEISPSEWTTNHSSTFDEVDEQSSHSEDISSSSLFLLSSRQATSVTGYTICPCSCNQYSTNETIKSEILMSIQKELLVDKQKVASAVRKKISIKDNRPSSSAIGIVGVVFILSVLVMLILTDIPKILQDFRYIRNSAF